MFEYLYLQVSIFRRKSRILCGAASTNVAENLDDNLGDVDGERHGRFLSAERFGVRNGTKVPSRQSYALNREVASPRRPANCKDLTSREVACWAPGRRSPIFLCDRSVRASLPTALNAARSRSGRVYFVLRTQRLERPGENRRRPRKRLVGPRGTRSVENAVRRLDEKAVVRYPSA